MEDDAARLVHADWLLERGDERGELIVLDALDRAGALQEPAALERLLVLAAEHGFPCLPHDRDAGVLPFYGGGSHPVQHFLDQWQGHDYYLRYRHGTFTIDVDNVETELALFAEDDDDWTNEETNVFLTIVSEAIRAEAPLDAIVFPPLAELPLHPAYRIGPYPRYALPDSFPREQSLAARDCRRFYDLYARLRRLTG